MTLRTRRPSTSGHEPRSSRALLRSATALTLTVGMVAAAALLGGTAATAVAQPTTSAAAAKPSASFEDGRYVVTLAASAVATYSGGVNGFAATKPAKGKQLDARSKGSRAYAGHLKAQQKKIAAAAGVSIDYSYTTAINGFAATLTAAQAATLYANRAVLSLEKDSIRQITAQSSTEFLGLGKADGLGGLWESTGGVATAGAGVVVGIVDTGIAPENASFAGAPLGTTSGAAPYRTADGSISFAKSDGGTFTGACVTGEQFTAADCSTKIVGARYYVSGFGASQIGDASVGEYVSPRDGDGHGSHTGSTAVGNHAVAASVGGIDFGTISGVAPAAKIAAYKVCWSGPDAVSQDDDGCATSDLVAAIDQATTDGVDVINFSIGGGAAQTTVSATDMAFLGAASAGIFVAASAGNSGSAASTLDNASPWITTVAASTIPSYEATATFGSGAKFAGGSITVPTTGVTGSLVRGDLVAARRGVDPLLCGPGSLDPTKVAGKIVFCARGVYARVDKSAEVKRAGGIGMVLVNPSSSSLDLDQHSVPSVHLNGDAYATAFAYAGTAGATVTLTPGNELGTTPATPQVAGFSSRGPVLADGSDIIKPDISAPGVAILAGGANAAGQAGTYKFLSGTSMSSPHMAGLAALYFGEKPTASPAEVKSAFMTTAYDTKNATGGAVTDPFTQGAGHVDPTKFFNPGFVYLNGAGDWWSYIKGAGYTWQGSDDVTAIDPSNLNLASIGIGSLTKAETVTRTVTSTQAGTFTPTVIGLNGITAVTSPAELVFDSANQVKSYTVTFTRTTAPLDTFATGSLNWTSGTTVVHSPLAVKPVTIEAPGSANGTGVSGSVEIAVTPGSTGPIALTTDGLAAGVQLKEKKGGPGKAYSGNGVAGTEITFNVQVPAGTALQRFDLDSLTDAADLDLIVYRLDGKGGTAVDGWQSATAATDEHVDLMNPTAGYYQVIVSVFSGNDTYDLTSFSVMPDGGVGTLTVPASIDGVQGIETQYTASWSGLASGTDYLGLVRYGTSGFSTIVSVKN
ncbi:S8 family serine peptidase [Cryobacterium sp. Sr8]|uniref:S8 family serine peptidase n=1 Tax=Cryobacterium sp. Sr8 TaxID=1259203 RepID=UPI001F54466E|nr:S8 family serine peptidase [Cryobacterium sp. Sr8]